MRRITYSILNRLLLRCEEIANEPGMISTVKNIYDGPIKPKADAYRSAFDAIAIAESCSRQETAEALASLKALERPYRTARSSVLAVLPTKVLPATLSMQPTDTDKLYAVQTLIDAVGEHVGQEWADDLLGGEFGRASTEAIKELSEAISAKKALAKATDDRASAYGPAYEGYLRFKRVVRDALGASSKQYRRIHLRGSSGSEATEAPEKKAEPTGAVETSPAKKPVNEP